MGAFGGVIAIERIFGALKRKFVKDGGYGFLDCQISKRGTQIFGILFAKEISITKHVLIKCYLQNAKKNNQVLHCKCLQGITGTLRGNQSAGISNLWGLHVYLHSL
jgi:hypothetical protein